MFDRLFGRRGDAAPAKPAVPVVRNVTIGRNVWLDTLAWRRLGADAKFQLERDTLTVTAQGLVKLDAGGYVHRFYTDDHLMLQMVSDDPDGAAVNDITLFQPWDSAYPANRGDRAAFIERLRQPSFTAKGLPAFPRLWFGEEGRQDPVSFWEALHDDRDGRVDRRIFQTCMLYARDLPGGGRELLLAIEQEADGEPVSHEVMLGVPLDMGEFRA